jgi:uncharacterized repeat protein (TIGR04052 family)
MTRAHLVLTAAALTTIGVAATPARAPERTKVTIRMAAEVGGRPVSCTETFNDIGTTKSSIEFRDFRFYVSNVRLIGADGQQVPVTLAQDGVWQFEDVALLDFEDGTGTCSNGTSQTRAVIEGSVPSGAYTGLAFDLGLPFDKNHRDPAAQPSPLNLTRLFWSWNAGYKFMRLDLRTTGMPNGWVIHLGSTGCNGATATTAPAECTRPNRVPVEVTGFDPATHTVVMDIAQLLSTSNVDANQPKTAVGCMSAPSDPECAPLFDRLGLSVDGRPAGPQGVFSVRR